MVSSKIQALINAIAFVGVLSFNSLANTLPLGGVTQRELSAEYDILLTPAGYVFAIWGVIYLGLFAYIVAQAMPSRRDDPRLRSLDAPFRLSCVFNVLWLTVWHYRFVSVSVLLMFGLLGSLMWAYVRLDKGRGRPDGAGRWGVQQTFSVYMGWVSLATMLNISVWLYVQGWNGAPLTPQLWTVILLGVALGLFLYLGFSRRDAALLGVLAWASVGIAIKNSEDSLIPTASAVVCALSVLAMARLILTRRPAVASV